MSLMAQMSKTWSLDLRNGWTDFDEIWYACRPCRGILKFKISDRSVRWGLSYDRAKIGILNGRDGWALLGETTVSPDRECRFDQNFDALVSAPCYRNGVESTRFRRLGVIAMPR
jgi:hypothetical protein